MAEKKTTKKAASKKAPAKKAVAKKTAKKVTTEAKKVWGEILDAGEKILKNKNFKEALVFVPFASLYFAFFEKKKTANMKRDIKYAIFLLIAWIGLTWVLFGVFSGVVTLVYLGFSAWLAYRVYNGEKIQIKQIDELSNKIKENL